MNTKEILAEHKVHEEQATSILSGLKIKKGVNDALSDPQVTAVKAVCGLLQQQKMPVDKATAQVLAESTAKSSSALAQSVPAEATAIAVAAPPISNEAATSLRGYAEEVIPPDGVGHFVNGALDAIDSVADQLTHSNGYKYGFHEAKQVAEKLPQIDQQIEQAINQRLGERRAKTSA